MDNILIHQKNTILALVNEDKFDQALSHLEFVRELWVFCDYGYKYKEIRQRISDRVHQLWAEADHWKTEQKWRDFLIKLEVESGLAT